MAHCPPCECRIGKDDFSANDGKPHAGWTYDNTFSTAAGNKPTNTGGKFFFAAPAIEIFDTANPDGPTGAVHAKAKVKLHELTAGHGAQAGIIVGWLDATTFLLASLRYHNDVDDDQCDYLQLWAADSISGGVRYLIARIPIRRLTLDEEHELHVCLSPDSYYYYPNSDTLRAYVKLADGTYWGRQAYATGFDGTGFTGGDQAGLILSNDDCHILDSQAYFDDWDYQHFHDDDAYRCCLSCNTPCFIFDDTLEHGDLDADTNLIGDEVYNGNIVIPFYALSCFWGVTAGVARFADTGPIEWLEIEDGGEVICRLPHPQSKTAKIVTVDSYWESGVVIVVNLGTGKAKFDPDAGEIRLYDNDDNLLETKTGLGTANDNIFSIEACYHDGTLTASATGVGVSGCLQANSPDTGNPYVRLAAEGAAAHFRNFSFSKYLDNSEPADTKCERCRCLSVCTVCVGDEGPGLFKGVMPSDMAGGLTECSGICPTDVRGTLIFESIDDCTWSILIFDEHFGCRVLGIIRALNLGDASWDLSLPGTYRIQVEVDSASILHGNQTIFWEKDYGLSKPDCVNFQDEEIPFAGYSVGGGAAGSSCVSPGELPVLLTAL